MKGIISLKGVEERVVFQGVHSLFEGSAERKWGPNEKRESRMVFIGRDLDGDLLRDGAYNVWRLYHKGSRSSSTLCSGFLACKAKADT
jgi:G3E family GTPase